MTDNIGTTIKIAPGWKIVRLDKYNWVIPPSSQRGGGRGYWYYGDLESALKAIPRKMLTATTAQSIESVISEQKKIKEMINRALFSL